MNNKYGYVKNKNVIISKYTFFCFSLPFFFSSCWTTSKIVEPYYLSNSIEIPMKVDSIVFLDLRTKTSKEKDIKLPLLSLPNQYILHVPMLTPIHKSIIEATIRKNTTQDSSNLMRITVELTQGEKEFSAKWNSETERVRVKLKITALNEKNKTLISSEASAESYITSIDAKNDKLENLYQTMLKSATYEALEYINDKITQKH